MIDLYSINSEHGYLTIHLFNLANLCRDLFGMDGSGSLYIITLGRSYFVRTYVPRASRQSLISQSSMKYMYTGWISVCIMISGGS